MTNKLMITPAPLGESNYPEVESYLERLFSARKITRVMLILPPDGEASNFRYDTAKRRRYPNYPAYGLAVLAQNLIKIGVEVLITNLNHEVLKACCLSKSEADFDFDKVWLERLDKDLSNFKPSLVGVSCMFTMTHGSMKKVCSRVKNAGVPVAIGGVHVTNDVERVLDDIPSADIAFLQEGDLAIQQFVKAVNDPGEIHGLSQVILADGPVRHRFLATCQPSSEIISVVPAYHLLEIGDSADYGVVGVFYGLKPKGTRFATALSNRGCRARCTFCSVNTFNGVGVRQRSVESVVEELEILRSEYAIDHIMWLDDDLLKDKKRVINLFNEMVRRNLGLTWDATNGLIACSIDDDVISAAATSGCIAVNIGVESGNPQILREIRKPGSVEGFIRAAEVLRRYEQIHVSVLLMVGFPGETMGMVRDTVNVARQMDLDWYRITQLQPLPNTPIYDSMVAQGMIQSVGDVQFTTGAFGTQVDVEQGRLMATPDFEEAFRQIAVDQVPTADQLMDVWFYMNYHLNFHRLFTENRPIKIEQQFKNLRSLSDVVAPENGFALYFLGYLQHKFYGKIEPEIFSRLEDRLATSGYWRNRLHAFGLSIDDLRNGSFEGKDIARIVIE